MWFDGNRKPNTIYVASVSRGKDSTAMLEAIKLMGWPLDMIVSVDIWFDEDTPAELPPMVAFKDEWDKKCLETFGVPVTRLCAQKRGREREQTQESLTHENPTSLTFTADEQAETISDRPLDSQCNEVAGVKNSSTNKLTYKDIFYRPMKPKPSADRERERRRQEHPIYGFPIVRMNWCNSMLKTAALRVSKFSAMPQNEGQKINIVHYIGIAADEPKRIAKHMSKKDMVMPLVQIGWEEELCGLIATYLDMLAPTYTTSMRDGCWFCHNQGVGQLRNLRKNYPDLWKKLMKLDDDSPVTFHADGRTVHDFDRRFQREDEKLIDPTKPFRWTMLEDELNLCLW